MTRDIICINCPVGCPLTVTIDGGEVTNVEGHECPSGESHAIKECVNPTRVVTSSVPVINIRGAMLSVKTASDIPKSKIFECMDALKSINVDAPIRIGDVIISNVADTGVDVVATRNVGTYTMRWSFKG